jgi:Tetratricopeptide repeat
VSRRILLFTCVVISLSVSAPLVACLWDYDNLAMERRQFPTVLELITGKFLRHSKAFYEWRARDRRERIKPDAQPQVWDDLAVAYEKLGRHEEAIATMQEKESLFPGLYETKANLGTFYFHAGKFALGLREIEAALAINPDAHFGREVYQKLLVQYMLDKQKDGVTVLPLDSSARLGAEHFGFANHVLRQFAAESRSIADKNSELDRAIKGVQAMMRFGNYDSPILLEALGDLLLSRGYPGAAKQLAARAFLQCSYRSKNPDTSKAYRHLANNALSMQTRGDLSSKEMPLEELEASFQKELKEADIWFESISANEKKWITESKNVDEEYAKAYYTDPLIEVKQPTPYLSRKAAGYLAALVGLLAMLGIAAIVIYVFRQLRKRASLFLKHTTQKSEGTTE